MSLISEIASGLVSPITNAISVIWTKHEDVSLEKFRVNGQIDQGLIQAHVSIIQLQAEVLKNSWMHALQFMFGFPTALYYGKCLVWDKVLARGSTDPLTGDVHTWALWIVGFLFLHSAVTEWSRKS